MIKIDENICDLLGWGIFLILGRISDFFRIIVQSSRSALAIYAFGIPFWAILFVNTYDNMTLPQAYNFSGLISIFPAAVIVGLLFVRKTWDGGIKGIIMTSIFFSVIMLFAAGMDYRYINVMFFLNTFELIGIEILLFALSIAGLSTGLAIRQIFVRVGITERIKHHFLAL